MSTVNYDVDVRDTVVRLRQLNNGPDCDERRQLLAEFLCPFCRRLKLSESERQFLDGCIYRCRCCHGLVR